MAFKNLNFVAAMILLVLITFAHPFLGAAVQPKSSESVSQIKTVRQIRSPSSPSTSSHVASTLTVVAFTFDDPNAPFTWAPPTDYDHTPVQHAFVDSTVATVPVVRTAPSRDDPGQPHVTRSRPPAPDEHDRRQDVSVQIVSASSPVTVVASPLISTPAPPITSPPPNLSLTLKRDSLYSSLKDPSISVVYSTPPLVRLTSMTRTEASKYLFRTTVRALSSSSEWKEPSCYSRIPELCGRAEYSPQTSTRGISSSIQISSKTENGFAINRGKFLKNKWKSVLPMINLPSTATKIYHSLRLSSTKNGEIHTPGLPHLDYSRNVFSTFPDQSGAVNHGHDLELQRKSSSPLFPAIAHLAETDLTNLNTKFQRSWRSHTVSVSTDAMNSHRGILDRLQNTVIEPPQYRSKANRLEHNMWQSIVSATRPSPLITTRTQFFASPSKSDFTMLRSPPNVLTLNSKSYTTGEVPNSFRIADPESQLHDGISVPPSFLIPPDTPSFEEQTENYLTTKDFILSPKLDRQIGTTLGDPLDTGVYAGRRVGFALDDSYRRDIGQQDLSTGVRVFDTTIADSANFGGNSLIGQQPPPPIVPHRQTLAPSTSHASNAQLYPALSSSMISMAGYFVLQVVNFLKKLKNSGATSSEEVLLYLQTNSPLKNYDFVNNPEAAFSEMMASVEANGKKFNDVCEVLLTMLPVEKKAKLNNNFRVVFEKFEEILSSVKVTLPDEISLLEIIRFLLPYFPNLYSNLEALQQSLELHQGSLKDIGSEVDLDYMFNAFNQGLDHTLAVLNSLPMQSERRNSPSHNFGDFWRKIVGLIAVKTGEISGLSLLGSTFSYYNTLITNTLVDYLSASWDTSYQTESPVRSCITSLSQLFPGTRDFVSFFYSLGPRVLASLLSAPLLNRRWDLAPITSYLSETLERIRTTWAQALYLYDFSTAIRPPYVKDFAAKKLLAGACLDMLATNWNVSRSAYMALPFRIQVLEQKGRDLGCPSLGFMDPLPPRLLHLKNLYRTCLRSQDPSDPLQVSKRAMEGLLQQARRSNLLKGEVHVWPGQDSYQFYLFST